VPDFQSEDEPVADELDVESDADLGGEDSGEAAAVTESFFVSKKAAAVLKHGILTRYLTPFVSKVGSTSPGNRVALLDGYAGPGRYEDGTAGSPALLAETARNVVLYRRVECHFVEQKRKSYKLLTAFLQEEGADLVATPYHGRVQAHLNQILSAVDGIPLFAYLDPFGFGVPFDEVVRVLRRHSGPSAPATEVLLNFTANGIRRAGGLLRPGRVTSASEEKTLQLGDAACGGTWWRETVRSNELLEDAVEAVALEYMRRVCSKTGSRGFALDVKNRAHHKPVYYLIYFSRHLDGLWLFNESVSSASADWRSYLAPPKWEPDPELLFDVQTEPSFEDEESSRAEEWVRVIEENILQLLTEGAFVIGEKMTQVYGTTLGEAREKHVRQAIKNLHLAGLTPTDQKGALQNKQVSPHR